MSTGIDGKREIFSQRLLLAVLWNIFLQSFLAIALVFVIQIDPLHPLSWIISTFRDIFGWKMSLNIVLLALVSFFQAFIYGSYYLVPLPKYFTRFSMMLNMFTLQNVVFSCLYALCGYFTMGLYSSLAQSNFNTLKKPCKLYDGQCLIEPSLFLQFAGMWMGLYYYLHVHVFSTSILIFPHVYQEKIQQLKMSVSNIIATGFKNATLPVAYYCFFYYLWGSRPRNVVSDVYSLYLEDPPLDNFFNLVRSGIWIGLWLYTSLFLISVYTMKAVFNLILTGPMKFPIKADNHLMLHKALEQRSQFNGYLAAQDLRLLAMTDPVRRARLFKLSQPGGHPRNWHNILDVCLKNINDFCKELENINGDGRPSDLNGSPFNKPLNISPERNLLYPGKLRNMAQSPDLYKMKDYNKNKVDNTFTTVMKEEVNTFIHKLCQKPGLNFFFGELTDTKLKFLLLQSQPVMWTCEGLAFIAASSLKEDNYGIVQTDLPIVISALINLKHNLDKLSKPGLVPRKHILHDELAIKMKSALTSAVKRSIYKIVITFSKYINEIPLDPEVYVAIQPFLMCKEA